MAVKLCALGLLSLTQGAVAPTLQQWKSLGDKMEHAQQM